MKVYPLTFFETKDGFVSPVGIRETELEDGTKSQIITLEPSQPPVSNEFVMEGCEQF